MSKILITGAAGFIASHVIDKLVNEHEVIGLDDLSGGFERNINSKSLFIKNDITDKDFVEALFEEHKFDYVYHIAAYAAEGLSHFVRSFNYNTNLIGSVNLINASVKHNIKAFVFTSSMAVYGSNRTPMTEDLPPMPEDPYAVAKHATELDLKAANKMFGLNYIIFRPHNVYGPKQNMIDKHRNVIAIFMNSVLSGKPIKIFGDGNQRRSFTYIDDISDIIANSINNPKLYNDVFNIGAEKEYSLNELADIINTISGKKNPIEHVEYRYEVKDAFCSSAKIKSVLGDLKETTIEDGIMRMWEWAKTQDIKEPVYFSNIEIVKNLPKSWIKKD